MPRWIILLIDTGLMTWAFFIAYFFVQDFSVSGLLKPAFIPLLSIYAFFSLITLYLLRTYKGLVRYTNTADIARILITTLFTSLSFGFLLWIGWVPFVNLSFQENWKLLVLNWCISTLTLILLRLATKQLYYFFAAHHGDQKTKVAVYGTDHRAIMVAQALRGLPQPRIQVTAFVDHARARLRSTIEQCNVYHIKDLIKLKEKHHVSQLFLVKEQLDSRDKQVLIERCLRLGIKVMTVPPVQQWMSGQINPKQVQRLRIEDLLERKPIVINNQLVSRDLKGKRILVTGAAGSIGSEVVRQVMTFHPEQVILCDQAESALHDVQLELQAKYNAKLFIPYMADICNIQRMDTLFSTYQPQVIFHAAAYKHVPMMEVHPAEAVLTNVGGTRLLADLAIKHNVEKFVMISTDKAVNPTNVMGASKRIAEIYTQTCNMMTNSPTRFITTRFGNVLGSNGSVIPRFRKQIEEGGPITVTHPEITRYFMTIPEAVQLVLEAGTMGQGGEIFVFDMGKPVKIADLATKMVLLAGLKPGIDIDIVYTGLRQGEKLYEELLNDAEKALPTHHEKISIARVRPYGLETVVQQIDKLLDSAMGQRTGEIVCQMKAIVPEFKSNNSPYEKFDRDLKKRPLVIH